MPSGLFENLVLSASKQVIPPFLYGTAWKAGKTADLVYQAICSGFRGLDTAAQPKHYREDLVGEGVRRALLEGQVARENLFVQSKYTSIQGQKLSDIPYNPKSSITEQVHESIRSSLRNLRPSEESNEESSYLDSLILHSPLPTMEQTLVAWKTAETYVPHKIRNLGISNINEHQLHQLYRMAKVKPAVVQNRFYGEAGYDIKVRKFCSENSVIYQSFWTLTANPDIVQKGAVVSAVANDLALSKQEAMYCLVLALGNITIINGTTNEKHMVGDLEALNKAKAWALVNPKQWQTYLRGFKFLIRED